jgi:endonuclease/exonuclease/phosphatase family metal-dependent hydrolase
MNAGPNSSTLKLLQQDWTVLTPAKTTFPDKKWLEGMTIEPSSADDTPGSCIDYILLLNNGAECEVVAADVCVRFESGSAFTASDHLPVYVDVRLQ